ncbi:TonB-dependent receptor [Catenovulum sp. SM1970]|uniref:TonB-dependent receptor domain-containing protein n=1 Tax=Marinifaba aquimaris TaxID=2741323 RepID=UPI00157346FD|nr:TonB-dependent receptor [Marinifaba aquimaris]NTS78137.1 TonB-dependent receptor [Marinifaba aquimaris]
MTFPHPFNRSALAIAITAIISAPSFADEDKAMEEIVVQGKSVSYANNMTSEEMKQQQSNMTSVLAIIDNVPGVLVNEGDTFGADDWSTTVSMRGFQLSLDEQQIGITIDGIANGNSNYGGGAKANRYIDTENLQTIEVSQGTADIASRSNEALGGTLNFTTIDPAKEASVTVSLSAGDFDSRKQYVRYDTGEFLTDTYAWVSVSNTETSDWVNQSADNDKFHVASKVISQIEQVRLEGYFSYDDTHEDNYQRISLTEFEQNPEWDRLTETWTGTPYVDQLYRKGWSTLRENYFAYLKADLSIGEVDFTSNIYYHDNEGRGDWVPPYIVDIVDDGTGNPHSEVTGTSSTMGGSAIGQIHFVNANGVALAPNAGCESSITFPYGGAGAEFDPLCYDDGAIPVGSYRHTHYSKERFGLNLDFNWNAQIGEAMNSLRGGLWYEDYERKEHRDWHKIIDSKTGYYFDHNPYWVQYSKEFPVETTMVYLEDTIEWRFITARLGVKKFMVDLESTDIFTGTKTSLNSDSDTLLSAGFVAQLPVEGLEVFAGFAENFAAIKDSVLEADGSALTDIEPETADNLDFGLRYASDRINASVTFYDIDFENRITFISPESPDGPDYILGTNGSYINVGGIESSGIEAAVTYYFADSWSLYASYTDNESEYVDGTSDYPKGNTVFGSVEDMMVLSIDYNNDKYLAGLSAKNVGERWMDPQNTQRIDAYTVLDFYAGVNLGQFGDLKDVQLKATVNNLNDESYIGGVAGGWGGWIGAPRTAAINLTASF